MPHQPSDAATGQQEPAASADLELLSDIGEDELLRRIFPLLPPEPQALVGPGDDAAVLRLSYGTVVLTTDTMVLGQDWHDEWSSARDVGAKAVAQNLADVAAMGAVPAGLLVTLIADPATPVQWAIDLAEGIGDAAAIAGTGVLGGDLSSAGRGMRAVSITAFGDLEGRLAVPRSGAQPGDVVAVAGTLGHAAAGLRLLADGRGGLMDAAQFIGIQRCPRPPIAAGPLAATVGVHAMIDLSDGLVRDAGRVARASGVDLDLDSSALAPDIALIARVLDPQEALRCVLTGGEDHSLLGCFSPDDSLPAGWRRVGSVRPAGAEESGTGAAGGRERAAGGKELRGEEPGSARRGRVLVDGQLPAEQGWDHFGG